MPRWLIAAAVICVAATGCSEAPGGNTVQTARQPQQAGPTNPLVTAGHMAGVEVAGLTGDQRAMQAHIEAMHKDMMRSMHLAEERALFQQRRQVDVLDPEVRMVFRAQQGG